MVFELNSKFGVLLATLTFKYRSLASSSNGKFEKFGCRADVGGLSAGVRKFPQNAIFGEFASGGTGKSSQSRPAKLSSRHPMSSHDADSKSYISGSSKIPEEV